MRIFNVKKKLKVYGNTIKKFVNNHEYLARSILFVILIVAFFSPVIFSGKTLTTSAFCGGVMPGGPYEYESEGYHPLFLPVRDPGAFGWQDEPLSKYIGNVIKNDHHVPIWNSNMALGYPILSGIQLGIFYPLNYIVFLFSSQLAWDIFILLKIFLAGFFTYVFARRIGLDKQPSTLAGVIFMFSGYTMNFLNMSHFSIEVLIPLVLLVYEYFLSRPNVKRLLLCTGVIALTILPGMPEATFFTMLIGSLWFLFSLFFLHREHLKKIGAIITFAVINILAFLLTAIQLIPFFELLGLSANSHSNSAVGLHHIPLDTATGTFFPFLFNPIHTWIAKFYYIGLSSLALAILAISSIRLLNKRNRGILLFFSAFAILGLAKVYGAPFINWIGSIPISDVMIYPKYGAPAIIFSLSIMAAYGFSMFIDKTIRYINTKFVFILASIILLTVYTFREKMPEFAVRIAGTDDFLRRIILFLQQLLGFKLPSQILESINASPTMAYFGFNILLGIIIYLAFWTIAINTKYRKSYFITMMLGFVICELFLYSLPLLRTTRYDTFKEAPYINFLKKDKEIHRVYGYNAPGYNAMLSPNVSSVFEIQDVRFLLAMGDKRYFEFLENVVGASEIEMATIRFAGESVLPLDSRYFDLMNVKYFLSPVSGAKSDIPDRIFKKGEILLNKKNVTLNQVRLNDRLLDGIMLHAPTKITFPFKIKDQYLAFEYGIADSGVEETNGVRFKIVLDANDGKKEVFNRLVDPKNNSTFQSWQKIKIDLSDYVGKEVRFTFEVQDNGNDAFDHFFVGNFSTDEIVYNDEIRITKNEDYFPRTFIVHRAKELFKPEDIFEELKNPDFDLKKEIIIEKDLPDEMLDSPESDNSKAVITSYEDQEVRIDAKMESDGFLVLLDQYYPGWKAYVDGKEVEIYPTDYVFRSIHLTKGTHKVVFRYEPVSYAIGKYISLAVILILATMYLLRNKLDRYINIRA